MKGPILRPEESGNNGRLMNDEHPIKKKVREAWGAAASRQAQENAEAQRLRAVETYARSEWPITRARLIEEVQRVNTALAEIPLNHRYVFHDQPQPGQGNAGRAGVSLTDQNTAATAHIDITVRVDGTVIVHYLANHVHDNFPLAAGSNSKWEEILTELHKHLPD
jgi:hypothetical protein